jgi:hypothetical protein
LLDALLDSWGTRAPVTIRKPMVRLNALAAVLIAASLSGCGSAMFDADPTASFPAGNNAANKPAASNSLFNRAAEAPPPAPPVQTAPVQTTPLADARPNDQIGALVAGRPAEATRPPAAQPVNIQPRGRAYLFRGIAGLIYSRGMDRLGERIEQIGITSTVNTYLLWRPVADQAINDYRRDPQPVILIGHSMGGDSAVAFAELLNSLGIPVSLMVTYDPSRLSDDVPSNVERYINIYQSLNVMGGGDIVQSRRFHGHYASYNLKDHHEIIHINIEKAEQIHEQIAAKIAELVATPAAAEGEAVPVRFVVPSGAPIELWDSGTPVVAHNGDTMQSLADAYHVPLWSIAQINRLPERGALSEGQRVIVPRHLVPMAAPANAFTSYAPR